MEAPPAALFVFGAWRRAGHSGRSSTAPIRGPEIDSYLTYGSWGERERVFTAS